MDNDAHDHQSNHAEDLQPAPNEAAVIHISSYHRVTPTQSNLTSPNNPLTVKRLCRTEPLSVHFEQRVVVHTIPGNGDLAVRTEFVRAMTTLLAGRSKKDIFDECASPQCPGSAGGKMLFKCESVQRIDLVLSTLEQWFQRGEGVISPVENLMLEKQEGGGIENRITSWDHYCYPQLLNDFYHIKLHHIDCVDKQDRNNDYRDAELILCEHFASKHPCTDLANLKPFEGHHKDGLGALEVNQGSFHPHADDTKFDSETISQGCIKMQLRAQSCIFFLAIAFICFIYIML